MKHNLLESFDTYIKPGLFNAIKGENPSTENTIFQYLSIVHASILGGLIQKCKKENGTKAIKNLLELGNHKGDIIDNIDGIFDSKEKLSDIKKLGNSLLSFVFEDGTDSAFEKIQHFLSEKYVTTEEDLIEVNKVVSPFTMALLGQIVHFEKLSEQQIKELLTYNETVISKRHPGLTRVLGLQPTVGEEQTEDDTSPENPPEENTGPEDSVFQEKAETSHEDKSDASKNDKEMFLNALWPWVLLFIISGLSLFILNKFKGDTDTPTLESTFPFIQSDSLILNGNKTYNLPGDVLLTVKRNGTLDSLILHLEKNQGIVDTLRFRNSQIRFRNLTSVLTTSASTELSGLVTILQAHPTVNMEINMEYDSTFFLQQPTIVRERSSQLTNYFNVFGLDSMRYEINTIVIDTRNQISDSTMKDSLSKANQNPNIPGDTWNNFVNMIFYQKQLPIPDTLNIQ